MLTNPKEGKSINAVGGIGFQAGNDSLIVRYTRIRKLPSTPVFRLSADEQKQGYEVLFDGRSLDKWQGNTTNYVPQNGNIYVTANYGGSGNLYTKKKYSDFVLRFDFCFDTPGVNNGVGVRTNLGTDAAYDGMEIQILDHDDPIYNGLMPYQQHGAVYGIIVPEHVKFDKVGTWYSEEIRVVGDRVKVTVNGKVIGKDSDFPENTGIIIEAPGFLPNYSGMKNLEYLASIRGKIGKEQIESAMKTVGLDPSSKLRVGKYSLGMKQRLGIAQAIMEDQQLLILDEPMNALDKDAVEEMRRLFLSFKASGKTMLIVSHNEGDISTLCDEVYEFDGARIKRRENV